MIGETNINGGAGLNGEGALLKINAETGSTITVSKEGYSKVIKTSQLDPDDNNRSYWFFQTKDFGEWTVTATKGEKIKSDTVLIANEGQSESVTLIYELVLFENGVINESVTGGFDNSSRLTIVDNNLKVSYGVVIGAAGTMDVTTKNDIDISAYDNVKLDVVSTSSSGPFAAGQEMSLQIIRNNKVLGQISLKGYKNQTAILSLDAYKSGGAVKLRFHMACNEGSVSAIISRFYLE